MSGICRVCKNPLFEKPILELEKIPKSAQYFPEKEEVKKDKGVKLKIFQCSGCGLVQLNRKPVHYYREVIRAVGISKEMMEFRREYFDSFIKKYGLSKKKIIEIGCGNGDYLNILNNFEVKAYGIEYSNEALKICKKRGLKVFKGFIEDVNYVIKNSPYDAFICLSFLEHIPLPNTFLRGVWNNLKEHAVGLVEVPNFDMIIRRRLFSEFIPDHLFYFSKDTLNSTLRMNGFEIIDIKEIWHEYIISAEVRKIKGLDLSNFRKNLEKLRIEIDRFIKSYKNVAIWGAGHQALAVISLMNLAKKIKYVVDSAPFKQSKYTPATHLPIVAPDMLNIEPVKAVIVMAGSYSQEVADILRQKYNKNLKVVILTEESLKEIN